MNNAGRVLAVALLYVAAPVGAWATPITVSLGNTSPGFTNGQHPTGAAVLTQQSGQPAPFNAACGSDGNKNCSTSWTFTYIVPTGESVTAGDLVLGIYDIDSAASGLQVATYNIVGGDNLTSALNTAAEALNSGAGSTNSEYDVFTLPLLNFAALNTGSVTVDLTLQGPGLGVLGQSSFNGASLLFSTLDLTTTPTGNGGNPNNPVPEPTSFLLVISGLGFARRVRRKVRAAGQF